MRSIIENASFLLLENTGRDYLFVEFSRRDVGVKEAQNTCNWKSKMATRAEAHQRFIGEEVAGNNFYLLIMCTVMLCVVTCIKPVIFTTCIWI
jgi:hypothetical protein